MKVFVSSTYLDLVDHRKAIDEIINRLEAQYRGMEYFGSRPLEPEKVCFSEISRCNIFVGIYAHRYGYIPKGATLSITEQEFDFAQSSGLACYCYVVSPTHPWPPQFIEADAALKIERFMRKVNTLLRSTFTTPDNLAKQVAADLVTALRQPFFNSNEQLLSRMQTLAWQEISNTIGPKYIRELYVNRGLNEIIKNQIKLDKNLPRLIEDVGIQSARIHETLMNAPVLEKNPKKAAKESQLLENARRIMEAGSKLLISLGKHEATSKELSFPNPKLHQNLKAISDVLADMVLPKWLSEADRNKTSLVSSNIDGTDKDKGIYWDMVVQDLAKKVGEIGDNLRPIYLVIDRAGGGKTNLLCNLTEDLGKKNICFFFAAKSIINPSEEAIIKYLASVYPIGDDPIRVALNAIDKAKYSAIVIVDGINECVDPFDFNAAFKSFVRRYYGSKIRFIVSCRDIYWKYFDDDWWDSHCSCISHDELHSYTEGEFRKALQLYLAAYNISAHPTRSAREQLHHPLLLRFFCEAYAGAKDKSSIMGQIDHIRLFGLFESYCERKFGQIADRLGLYSGDEVFNYLKGIAQYMLNKQTRSLSTDVIAVLSAQKFNERSIRSVDSKYIQILDEDILLEQKPIGQNMTLMVSFVYEEFMEYTMAASIWSGLQNNSTKIGYKDLIKISEDLFRSEGKFISALGIVFYLGSFLTKYQADEGINFIDWLISVNRESIACRMMAEWPVKQRVIFQKITKLHSSTSDIRVKKEAWRTIERIYTDYIEDFFRYIKKIKFNRSFGPGYVYKLLADAKSVFNSSQMLNSVILIAKMMQQTADDFSQGLAAIEDIIFHSKRSWDLQKLELAESIRSKVNLGEKIPDLPTGTNERETEND